MTKSFWRQDPSDILPDGPHYDVKAHIAHVKQLHARYPYRIDDVAADKIIDMTRHYPTVCLEAFQEFAADLLEDNDIFIFDAPTLEYAPYLTKMQKRLTRNPDPAFRAVSTFLDSLAQFVPKGDGSSTIPLSECFDAKAFIGSVIRHFYQLKIDDEPAFPRLRDQIFDNIVRLSGYDPQSYDGSKKLVDLDDNKDPPARLYATYLANTPFLDLLDIRVPFGIPLETQFAHTWVVAGSGHGKTTALTSMIFEHIPAVLRGDASIVIIDSQAALIPALERLKIWEDNDRLIVVDPSDPVAFNLFDVPYREPGVLNNALDMIEFIFAKLSDSDLTYRQRSLYEYLSEFLITAVPNATIHDFRDMLDQQRAPHYDQYKSAASQEVRDYLATDFVKEKFTLDARAQVVTKLRRMLRQPAFVQMFGAPETKLNLFKELERGICILIRPDQHLLGDDATRLFGRFWIAQMRTIAMQRQTTAKKTPTFFYIDEAQDYLKGGDPKIEGILEQARKQNIGLTLLHHYGDQFKSTDLLNLLGACTSTKICGSLNTADLSRFAGYLDCEPGMIKRQEPRKSFAVGIRGKPALSLSFPYINLAKEPCMSEDAWRAMRARNRARYGAETAPEGGRFARHEQGPAHVPSVPSQQKVKAPSTDKRPKRAAPDVNTDLDPDL